MAKKKEQTDPSPETVSRVFAMMGKKGGPARRDSLSPARRKEIARAGAAARWAGKKKKPK